MEKEIPKIDLPLNMIIGTDISPEILNLYTNFPCRLKAEIFVFCMEGEIEASIDLNRISVKAFDFITILPGSIFQIHKVPSDLKIYFMGFSSSFLGQANMLKNTMDIIYRIKERPVISLREKAAYLMKEYFELLIKTYAFVDMKVGDEIANHLFSGIHIAANAMYRDKFQTKSSLSKSEQISKEFGQLVIQNYSKERTVAWYAHELNITHAHLCTTVKQITGKTCIEIISDMVIMDAKSQLKSSNLSIRDIAYSLNFTNMSFFGKYFKRHVGIGPQEYRNT